VAAYADWVHTKESVSGTLVTSDAYSVVPSVVLTGEEAEPRSFILPRHPLDFAGGGIGALLLVGGAGRFRASDGAFVGGAAVPATAMQAATVYGGGFNWYPHRGIALLSSFGHMVFDAHGANARPTENTLIVRFHMVL